MEYPAFVGPSYQSQAVTADQEQTMNWYVEPMEVPGATSPSALYPTPGVEALSSGATGVGRGHLVQTYQGVEREFVVIGPTLYEVDQFGALTSRGLMAVDSNPATLCSNGDAGCEVFITSGNNGYIFNMSANTLTLVRTGATRMGVQLDGYFFALDTDTSTVYASELLDGTTWTGTSFAQRTKAPDPWVSMAEANGYVWLLGKQTSEAWYDAGTSPFPLAPDPSAGLIPYGCAATFSTKVSDAAVIWLGRSASGQGQVIRTSGFTPEIVSTFPITKTINGYTTVSDASGDIYTDLGHTFYVLTFPTANATWAWDFQTESWAERGTWISESNVYVAWRPLFHGFAFGEHRILDRSGLSLYRMSSTLGFDVESRPIRRLRRAPAIVNELQRLFFASFELDLEPGLGLTSGQGSNPQVMLRMSNDGGKTWGNELWRSAGQIGEYLTRVKWNRCGQARRRVFEVSVSDPIPWRLTNAYLRAIGEVA